MVDIVKETGTKEYYWIKYINQRIRQNKNFLAIISGQTGSGKSWSALSIGEMLDDSFDITRVIFKGKELMELVNNANLKKGSVLVWDEAGIDLSNRNWQTLANKMLNYLLQTFRHKGFILLFTAPYSDFLDKATRKLFHAELKTVSIDFNLNKTKLKPQLIQYNSRTQKFYYKYLRVITKKDGVVPLSEWSISKPSDKLIADYETKKNKFTNELNLSISESLNKVEKTSNRKIPKALTPLQKQILDLWNQGIHSTTEIAKRLNKKIPQISMNLGYIRRKGVVLEV